MDGCSEVMANTRAFEPEDLEQFRKPRPVVAAPLTAAIEHPEENPLHLIVEVIKAVEIPAKSVVLVVPSQLGIQLRKEDRFRQSTMLTAPRLDVGQGRTVFRACRSTLEHRLTPAPHSPSKLKPQEHEGAARLPLTRTEPNQVRFLRGNLQAKSWKRVRGRC